MSQEKGLYRSNNRVLGGVCAGVAEYFNFDITLTRLVYALLTIFTAFSGVWFISSHGLLCPRRLSDGEHEVLDFEFLS